MAYLDDHAEHTETVAASQRNRISFVEYARPRPLTPAEESKTEGVKPAAIQALGRMRAILGDKVPISINSGYRTPERNASVGGARNSQHIHGSAFDIKLPQDPAQRLQVAQAAYAAGFRGFGFYGENGHLHVDIGAQRVWGSAPKGLESFGAQIASGKSTVPQAASLGDHVGNRHDRTLAIIRTIESSDGKNLIGPMTKYGQAFGEYQMLTSTARDMLRLQGSELAKQSDGAISQALLKDPALARRLASNYISQLDKKYGGNQQLVALAYHSGAGNVDAHIKQYGNPANGSVSMAQFMSTWQGPEGRKYVEKFAKLDGDTNYKPNYGVASAGSSGSSGNSPSVQSQIAQKSRDDLASATANIVQQNMQSLQNFATQTAQRQERAAAAAEQESLFNKFKASGDNNGNAESDSFGVAGNADTAAGTIANSQTAGIFGAFAADGAGVRDGGTGAV